MANIYEMYGRQAEDLGAAKGWHRQTMALLNDLVSGKVSVAELTLTPDGWRYTPSAARPSPEDPEE